MFLRSCSRLELALILLVHRQTILPTLVLRIRNEKAIIVLIIVSRGARLIGRYRWNLVMVLLKVHVKRPKYSPKDRLLSKTCITSPYGTSPHGPATPSPEIAFFAKAGWPRPIFQEECLPTVTPLYLFTPRYPRRS